MTLRELREQNGKSRAEVARKLNQRAREVWLNAKHTKEDEIFSLEKKKVGTK